MWKSKTLESTAPVSSDRAAPPELNTASTRTAETASKGSAGAPRPASSPIDSRSLLGSSLQIKGEISGGEDLQLDCSVDGNIRLAGRKLTVGANARILANIVAAEVVVLGNVKGNLSASDRIEIKKDGTVVGELATSRIMIEDGAYFKGTIVIDHKTSSSGKELPDAEKGPEVHRAALRLSGGTPTLYLTESAKERSGD